MLARQTTHKNLTSVIQVTSGVFPDIVAGKDVFLGILPFFHIFGAIVLLFGPSNWSAEILQVLSSCSFSLSITARP